MEKKAFCEAREALIRQMHSGGHCEESIQAISECKSPADFVAVLRDFRVELGGRRFPKINWLRKYMACCTPELEAAGFYFDRQGIELENIEGPLFLYGKCECVLHQSTPHLLYVVASGSSVLRIQASGYALIHVTLKDQSEIELDKNDFANVKIVRKWK